jgi:hypothetical protein
LSFSTHAEVAALDLAQQRELLDRAVAEGWSSREMREAVKQRRELGDAERDECGDLVAEMAANLRAGLRGCGLGETVILVEVNGAGFSYEVRIP